MGVGVGCSRCRFDWLLVFLMFYVSCGVDIIQIPVDDFADCDLWCGS